MSKQSVFLVLTSALVIDGEVIRAGTLVEVSEREAKNFLHRGKARLATEADGAPKSDEKPETDLSRMSKAQLLAFAESNEIEVSENMTKAEIIAAINASLDAVDE